MVNFLLRGIFRGNLNEAILLLEITSFTFPRNDHNKQKIYFTQSAITCSKLTIETLEQSVKYVQS